MVSKAALERVFGPLTDIDITLDMYVDAPIECRPCQTGQISEITECNHCKFNCKVEDSEFKTER